MKCIRCGRVHEDNVEVCDVCHFNFKEYQVRLKYFDNGPKPEDLSDNKSDLIVRPILSFIFGVLGLIFIGTFIFSILAIKITPNLAKSTLKPVRTMGIILGYIGIAFSGVFLSIIIYLFMAGAFS